MELVYVYVEKYKKLKKFGINLSTSFSIEFLDNLKSKLKCERLDNRVNIYSRYNISSLTAIVGENGCGKTSVLELIRKISRQELVLSEEDTIVFYDDNNKEIISNKCIEIIPIGIKYKSLKQYQEEKNIQNKRYCDCFMKTVSYSEVFNYYEINEVISQVQPCSSDLTIGGRIRMYYDNHVMSVERNMVSFMKLFAANEYKRQIESLLKNNGYFSEDDVNITNQFSVNKVTIEYVDYENKLIELVRHECGYELYNEPASNSRLAINKNNSKYLLAKKIDELYRLKSLNNDKMLQLVIYSLLSRILKELHSLEEYDEMIGKIETWKKIANNNKLKSEEKCVNISKIIFNNKSLNDSISQCYYEVIKFLASDRVKKINEFKYEYFFESNKDINDFYKFYQKYDEAIMHMYDFLSFSWPMSSGELAYFNMYAQLKTIKTPLSDILLLLDEVDLYMHPRWQQEYINRLVHIVKEIFPNKNIQIILTTHSPIILSDIPSHNIVYMLNGENVTEQYAKRTFAQNIYSLYMNSFFLDVEDNIWVHGRFVENLLIELSRELDQYLNSLDKIQSNSKERLDYIKQIIDLIGEDLIRTELNKKLTQIMNLRKNKDVNQNCVNEIINKMNLNSDQVKELESFLEKLEKEKGGIINA